MAVHDRRKQFPRPPSALTKTSMTLTSELQSELDALKAAGTYKRLNHLEGPQGARVRMEGRGEVIVLS